jgi:2-methylisocitrate lyase-like PEP mutase family enzyme
MGLSGPTWSVEQLAEAGVKRISVGGSMARSALGEFMRAAREVLDHGTFTYASRALPHAEALAFMRRG